MNIYGKTVLILTQDDALVDALRSNLESQGNTVIVARESNWKVTTENLELLHLTIMDCRIVESVARLALRYAISDVCVIVPEGAVKPQWFDRVQNWDDCNLQDAA